MALPSPMLHPIIWAHSYIFSYTFHLFFKLPSPESCFIQPQMAWSHMCWLPLPLSPIYNPYCLGCSTLILIIFGLSVSFFGIHLHFYAKLKFFKCISYSDPLFSNWLSEDTIALYHHIPTLRDVVPAKFSSWYHTRFTWEYLHTQPFDTGTSLCNCAHQSEMASSTPPFLKNVYSFSCKFLIKSLCYA